MKVATDQEKTTDAQMVIISRADYDRLLTESRGFYQLVAVIELNTKAIKAIVSTEDKKDD